MTTPEAAPDTAEELADQAAPLDALLVDAALGTLRRFVPDASAAKLAVNLVQRPRTTARRLRDLAAEFARIGAGTSELAPAKRDRRFTDPAWMTNPVLRRAVQAYLAAGQAASQLVGDAALPSRDERRIRFGLDNLVEALSPSNVPLLNPLSAKALVDTGGLNVVRGGFSFLRDLATPPRIPEMVDRSAFEVGRNIAVTPGAVVLRTEVLELIQYTPQTDEVRQVPLLIVPPTINKFYALDLAQGRSMIEYLVRGGQQVFVISWRNPDARHAGWGLDAYVQAVLDALDAVERVCGIGRTALMGVCAGGIIASITAAHLAAIGQQERLACLSLLVTVLDTTNAGTAAALVDRRLASAAKAMSRRRG
jgi:polyhydroxyalkanoate synthase subunit PhaC